MKRCLICLPILAACGSSAHDAPAPAPAPQTWDRFLAFQRHVMAAVVEHAGDCAGTAKAITRLDREARELAALLEREHQRIPDAIDADVRTVQKRTTAQLQTTAKACEHDAAQLTPLMTAIGDTLMSVTVAGLPKESPEDRTEHVRRFYTNLVLAFEDHRDSCSGALADVEKIDEDARALALELAHSDHQLAEWNDDSIVAGLQDRLARQLKDRADCTEAAAAAERMVAVVKAR